MADPTPTLRDQGRQALQAGNLDAAVDFLSRAVMASDADADAKMMLGIAYSMKGLHPQAKRALEGAVAGAPQNPDYRFNLGMVLEKAGDMPGAAQAFRETLQLNPQHPQARAKLQALGPQAGYAPPAAPQAPPGPPAAPPSAPTPSSTYGTPPTWGTPPGSPAAPLPPQAPSAYGQPPAGGGLPGLPPIGQQPIGQPPIGQPPIGQPPIGQPPIGQPPIGGAPLGGLPPIGQPPVGRPGMAPPPPTGTAPLAGPPPMGAPIGGPAPGGPPMGAVPGMTGMQAPDGMVQCPRCGQFTRAGMLCEMCSTPLPPPPRQTASPGPAAFGSTGPVPGYVAAPPADNFDVRDGFAQWGQTLISPKSIFEEQVGKEGFKEPGAFILAWCIAHSVLGLIVQSIAFKVMPNIGGIVCGWWCLWLMVMGVLHVWSGLLHGTSRLFGAQGSYAQTFRTATYGAAPLLLCITIGMAAISLLMPKGDSLPNASAPTAPRSAYVASIGPSGGSSILLAQFNPPNRPTFGAPRSPYGSPYGGTTGAGSPDQQARIRRLQNVLSGFAGAFLPAALIIGFGYLWSLALLVVGVSEVHSVGTGPAIGAVFVAAAIMAAVIGGISVVVGSAIGAAVQQVLQGMGGSRSPR